MFYKIAKTHPNCEFRATGFLAVVCSAAEVVAGLPCAKFFDECPRYNLLPVIPSSREFDSTELLAWAGEGDKKLRK